MISSNKNFLDLPPDIQQKILRSLSVKEVRSMIICKGIKSVWDDHPAKVYHLLRHVALGEQSEAEEMLKNNPGLLLYPGQVKDYSGRDFKNITAFQYALWAMDWHMWTMILKYLDPQEALVQLNDLESNFSSKSVYGAHYNFKNLLDSYNNYCYHFKYKSREEQKKDWCENVGGELRNVPVHVANEYCRLDRNFDTPSFTDENLPRTLNMEGNRFWYDTSGPKILGTHYAVIRGDGSGPKCREMAIMDSPLIVHFIKRDRTAIAHLQDVRMQQFADLKKMLNLSCRLGCKAQ